MRRPVFITLFVFLSFSFAASQDLIKARGTAQMVLEDDFSKEELKEKLRMQAKINAIENHFGSIIEQESRIEINEGGTYFNIVGDSYLKGEWLKTDREYFKEEYKKVKTRGKDKFELWVSCKIEGLIREIDRPEVDFEFTSTNCPDKRCRTTDFFDGESMYLFFKAPVEGFLTVFTVENEHAYRILPYQQMLVHFRQHVPVEADKEYLFFSADYEHNYFDDFSPDFADELIMTTSANEEYLYLYIVFSVSEFIKPTLDHSTANAENDLIVPQSLKLAEFESWLSENRVLSRDFYFKKMRLKIIK